MEIDKAICNREHPEKLPRIPPRAYLCRGCGVTLIYGFKHPGTVGEESIGGGPSEPGEIPLIAPVDKQLGEPPADDRNPYWFLVFPEDPPPLSES